MLGWSSWASALASSTKRLLTWAVGGQLGRQDLERDVLLGQGVAALVDHAHPALAEDVEQLVLAEHGRADQAVGAGRRQVLAAVRALDVDVEDVLAAGGTGHRVVGVGVGHGSPADRAVGASAAAAAAQPGTRASSRRSSSCRIAGNSTGV